MKKLLSQMIAAVAGLWLASSLVPGVQVKLLRNSNFFGVNVTAQWQIVVMLGIILGLLNYFVKPILNAITLPLRILTLGLFGFLINMALIWVVGRIFKELSAPWLWPLFYTTLIIWALNIVISIALIKES